MAASALRFGLVLARRSIATGLLCLSVTLFVAPIFVADPQSNLPLCCRRDGEHHCGMIHMSGQATRGARLSAVTPKCPLFPQAAPSAHGIQWCPYATQTFFQGVVRQAAYPRQAVIQYRVFSARAHRTRGPPRSASLNLMHIPRRGTA
jgi:hypothetical protein